jgi:primary-amine oxidase
MKTVSMALLFAFLLASTAAFAQNPATPSHPLDPLTLDEYWTIYDTVKATGKVAKEDHFASVLLHEPDKKDVLAWKSGDPLHREADVILNQKGIATEIRVDVTNKTIESWKQVKGVFPPIVVSEFHDLNEMLKSDKDVQAALAKRGITDLDLVDCEGGPIGYHAIPDQDAHRVVYAGCSYRHGVYHTWGRPIEGLMVLVDLNDMKILKIVDEGVVPVPTSAVNYEDAAALARPGTTPIEVNQPLGPSYQIKDGEVSWQGWKFRFRVDPRVGPIVHLAQFSDGQNSRSVLYEGSLSEMYVPYMDPGTGWSWQAFYDAGEFFLMGIAKPLDPDFDCPSNAEYFSGLVADDHGIPTLQPRLACLFERPTGDPSWRHEEQDGIWGRPGRELVLRAIATIGNYDYILDWRFKQEGAIQVAVGATGIIEVKGVKQTTVDGAMKSADSPDAYGNLVAPNTVGVDHDHFLSFRLDLDVNGQNNSFMATRLVQKKLDLAYRKTIWVPEPSVAKTEKDAMMDIDLRKPSMWMFIDSNSSGSVGHPYGYEIMPGVTAASLLDPEDGPQKVGAFSEHQLWVTPYVPDERYASGVYPTASKGDDGLAVWTKANRPIENTDIVAWYTMGFHHVPRQEDWPVMPTMWHDFTIRPYDFFQENPVLHLPMKP